MSAVTDLRRSLLEAAEAEVNEVGAASVSLRSIARRCAMNHQGIRHYFKDRAALLTALAADGFARLNQQSEQASAVADIEAGQQLAAVCGAYVHFALAHRNLFELMFSPLIDDDDPTLEEARGRHRDIMMATVDSAKSTGWGPGVPTEMLATIGWAAMHGLAVLQREQSIAKLYPDVDLDQLFAQIVKALDALT